MDAGDSAAMAWELRPSLMRMALAILRNGADAEDAVSDAMLRACLHSGELRDESRFKSWLMRILVRRCYDELRKRGREVLTDDFAAFDRPVLENTDGTVFELILGLPRIYRDVLTLFYYEGFKAAEIAEALAVPAATILVRLSRGRRKLRALIAEEEGHCEEDGHYEEEGYNAKQAIRRGDTAQNRDGAHRRTAGC